MSTLFPNLRNQNKGEGENKGPYVENEAGIQGNSRGKQSW